MGAKVSAHRERHFDKCRMPQRVILSGVTSALHNNHPTGLYTQQYRFSTNSLHMISNRLGRAIAQLGVSAQPDRA